MNRVRRNEKVMERMVARKVIDKESLPWLKAALDPYHDLEIDGKISWPDANTGASVTRVVKRSVDVRAPTEMSGTTWSCLINNNPLLNHRTIGRCKASPFRYENSLVTVDQAGESGYDDSATYDIGFLNIDTIEGDEAFAQLNMGFYTNSQLSLPDAFCLGKGRLVAAGYEIHNVSPELYKSGTITVGRYPQPSNKNFSFNFTRKVLWATSPPVTAQYTESHTHRHIVSRPDNLADAMLLPGTRQWSAEEGAYIVVPFNDQENPDREPDWICPLLDNNEQRTKINSANTSKLGLLPLDPYTSPGCPTSKWAPVDSTFAYCTGLSRESVLRVNLVLYYESFPGILDADLITLATPSVDYDPKALAFYKHAVCSLPVGVPVGMNNLGDWFAMVVSEYSDLAGAALSALGVPGAGLAAAGAKRLADTHLKNRAKEKPQSTAATYANSQKKKRRKNKDRVRAVALQ